MRIITGKYRARNLVAVDSLETRPTLARVKESIFNLISDRIAGSIVLDLFAGSGAFGVECISRGAEEVYFVDRQDKAISAIRQNTSKMTEKFEIIKANYQDALNKFYSTGLKFNLVYLDPPYDSDYARQTLEILNDKKLLLDNATIVVEHKFVNDLQNIPDCYIIKKSKKYGIAYVDVFTYEK